MNIIKKIIKKILNINGYKRIILLFLKRLSHVYLVPRGLLLGLVRNRSRSNDYGTNANRVLVFNIFENEPRVLQYKLHFLKALRNMVEHCLIVVNGNLSELDKQVLSEFGDVIIRSNEGYDAAAFREGILRLGKETLVQYDQLLLVNDTNVGPFYDFEKVFASMPSGKLDFWGLTRGEVTSDFTGYNPYGYIPDHLQSYFLVIENSLLKSNKFYKYWEKLTDTNSREKAIGKHETVFTKYFSYLGYKYDAFIKDASDSAMYLHPMKILAQKSPIVKFSAFANFDRAQILWGGLERHSEWPELMAYIKDKTDYPMAYIDEIMKVVYEKAKPKYVLLVDGVGNAIPQCTRYRVENKAEELQKAGFAVKIVNASQLYWGDGKHASHIIIYRAGMNEALEKLIEIAQETGKPIFYDIDDLVFDTVYTDKLAYTQQLSAFRKAQYDGTVNSYHDVLVQCDGAIGSTQTMVRELQRYVPRVILNRNKASQELVRLSQQAKNSVVKDSAVVRIGYFSGSITHNENFDVIKNDVIQLMETYPFVQLHVVGHLDIPESFKHVKDRVIVHPYVSWEKLPELIASVDINVAPLAYHVFNEAKSEIKWIEAALVGVPTVASKIGAFKESIRDKETGLLVVDGWYAALESLVVSPELREEIGQNAYEDVMAQCTTGTPSQQLVEWLQENE